MKLDLNQILEKLNSLPLNVRYGIFAGVLLLLVAADYFLLMRPQLAGMKSVHAETLKTQGDTARVKSEMERINAIRSGLEGMRGQLQAVSGKLRSSQEVSLIFEEISKAADGTGLKIDQLSLAPGKDGKDVLIATEDTKYFALPIVIIAHSGYHTFGRFLNKLEAADLLFMVQDLKMESGAAGGPLTIQATLNIIMADKIEAAQ